MDSDRTFTAGATLARAFAGAGVLAAGFAAPARVSTALVPDFVWVAERLLDAAVTALAAEVFLTGAAFFATGLLTTEDAFPGFAAGLVVVFVTALAGALGTDFEGTAGFFWVDTGD
ncbi:MAG: hypothetical protein Q8K50_18735, partial [Hydrogenophaga sp.]|nr:hypothetical protein [Hydrogenophaga sp.]